ncbi:hypothetical protein SEA_SANSA_53 [Microbacterium phage Sansa]|uniref:Uncharacterized protein n=1 Tax=Microbacterium phage Sansa TaxID=2250298 RepID=A0A345L024_9CAUD|nr:hypothetical protein SEA_SANSA_53 [Microbacterium phage Sansa]
MSFYEHLMDELIFGSAFHGVTPDPVPNTFLANPVPREGYIDARRDDGCVAVITSI